MRPRRFVWKLTRSKKLSFYQIKYILDYRSSYGHVGNRDTPITRKIETASFCAKVYKVLSWLQSLDEVTFPSEVYILMERSLTCKYWIYILFFVCCNKTYKSCLFHVIKVHIYNCVWPIDKNQHTLRRMTKMLCPCIRIYWMKLLIYIYVPISRSYSAKDFIR